MKRKTIIIWFGSIALIMLLVWLCAYRPVFSGPISSEHADWGNFGDFFWGLGTMLLTGLNVIVLFMVNKQLREYNDKQQEYQNAFELKLEEERKTFQIKAQREEEFARYINNFQQILVDSINKEDPSESEMMFFSNKLLLLLWSLKTLDWLPNGVQQEIIGLETEVTNFLVAEAINPSKNKQVEPLFSVNVIQPSIKLYQSLITIKGRNLK